MICEAIIHRPKRIATPLGTLGQILYAINPKSIDYILNSAYKLFPDSSAAQGREAARAHGPARPADATGRGGLQGAGRVRLPDARRPLVAGTAIPAAQALGLGVRGPAARPRRAARGGGRRDPRAARVRRRGGRGAGAARGDRAAGAAGRGRRRRSRSSSPPTTYERVSHALGKAYRDVVRGFRGQIDNPPDLVAHPRDEARGRAGARVVRRARGWRRSPTAAAPASSAGSSRGWATPTRGAVTIDLGAPRPGARGRSGLAGGADPGRGPRARRSRTSSASTG